MWVIDIQMVLAIQRKNRILSYNYSEKNSQSYQAGKISETILNRSSIQLLKEEM
jgi:hypothetical protein